MRLRRSLSSGLSFLMDSDSAPFLEEATIDYVEEFGGQVGFVINNPMFAGGGCGCGSGGSGGSGGRCCVVVVVAAVAAAAVIKLRPPTELRPTG